MTWSVRAACIDLPAEVFFPTSTHSDYDLARRVCASCPVRAECLEENRGVTVGFFAGLTAEERADLDSPPVSDPVLCETCRVVRLRDTGMGPAPKYCSNACRCKAWYRRNDGAAKARAARARRAERAA